MNGKTYTKAFKALMVQRALEGELRADLCATYGIARSSLANWISQSKPGNKRSKPPTIAEVRRTLAILDAGFSIEQVIETAPRARSAEVYQEWVDDPRYREATFEFDPEMNYDYHDLIDRSIVTHHLCTQTPSKDERLDLVAALLSPVTQEIA